MNKENSKNYYFFKLIEYFIAFPRQRFDTY